MLNFKNKNQAAQDFIPLKEVRDGIVILNDNSMRAILLTSSINFALKDASTQEAIIMQFQNFLNSLDFSVQIFIQSRRLDIRPYLALLEDRYKAQQSDLMKVQTREYIDFIKSFTESTNIMNKSFFIVIPYAPAILENSKGLSGSLSKLKIGGIGLVGGKQTPKETGEEAERLFAESRAQLDQRIAIVEQGLSRTGIRVAMLGSEEIIELFYKLFNPGETEKPIELAS